MQNMTSLKEALARNVSIFNTGQMDINNIWNVSRSSWCKSSITHNCGVSCLSSACKPHPAVVRCLRAVCLHPDDALCWSLGRLKSIGHKHHASACLLSDLVNSHVLLASPQVEADHGHSVVSSWPCPETVRGSDATQFRPGLTAADKLTVFVGDLFQTRDLVVNSTVELHGIKLFRYWLVSSIGVYALLGRGQ